MGGRVRFFEEDFKKLLDKFLKNIGYFKMMEIFEILVI